MKKWLIGVVCTLVALSLGVSLIHCGSGSNNNYECTKNTDCKLAGQYCNLLTHKCVKQCAKDCSNRQCGPDPLCGESCGVCDAPAVCNANGQCEGGGYCTGDPDCKVAGEHCNLVTHKCEKQCTKDCTNRECGLDPVCGVSCGTCTEPKKCTAQGKCEADSAGTEGAACPFQATENDPVVNAAAAECLDTLQCIGIAPNAEFGTCQKAADCTDFISEWNPDCVGGKCGSSFCSKACDAQGKCAAGFEPWDLGTECYCAPLENGPGQPGDPCPFQATQTAPIVNETAGKCAAKYKCIGMAADGKAGTCTVDGDCTDIASTWNRDCVNKNCGASVCTDVCDAQDKCPAGFDPMKVDTVCRCVPAAPSAGCDPLAQTGCTGGKNCIPTTGTGTKCIPAGTVQSGQPCSATKPCAVGLNCVGSDNDFQCLKFCDKTDDATCDGYCWGLQGVDKWGVCEILTPCDMTKMSAECVTGYTCIIWDDACTDFRCLFTEGKTIGQACQYSNSCAKGLYCTGDPGTCNKVCTLPAGTECTGGKVCTQVDPCPETWGVCLTE